MCGLRAGGAETPKADDGIAWAHKGYEAVLKEHDARIAKPEDEAAEVATTFEGTVDEQTASLG